MPVFKLNDRVWEEVKQKRVFGLDRFPDFLSCLGVSALFAKLILTRVLGENWSLGKSLIW